MNLQDQVIVVTGAAQGLGRAMAEEFAKQGANIALVDMQAEVVEAAATEIEKLGVRAKGYGVNVTDEQQVETVFAKIAADFGQINGLINSAGIMRDGMLLKVKEGQVVDKMPLQQFQSVLDVNVTGTFLCSREAAAQMVTTKSKGVIVNISSVSRAGNAGQTNYAASKAGIIGFSKSVALELGSRNIRSNVVAPGFIETEMTGSLDPEVIKGWIQDIPMKRSGTAQDVANAALFLASDLSNYVNGQVLNVCGGIQT